MKCNTYKITILVILARCISIVCNQNILSFLLKLEDIVGKYGTNIINCMIYL